MNCEHCNQPMKELFFSIYCDCEEVESNDFAFKNLKIGMEIVLEFKRHPHLYVVKAKTYGIVQYDHHDWMDECWNFIGTCTYTEETWDGFDELYDFISLDDWAKKVTK